MARQMEKKAANISTSEDGQFEMLSQPCSQDREKRLIKKPKFYDELQDDCDETCAKRKTCVPDPPCNYMQRAIKHNLNVSTSMRSASCTLMFSDINQQEQNESSTTANNNSSGPISPCSASSICNYGDEEVDDPPHVNTPPLEWEFDVAINNDENVCRTCCNSCRLKTEMKISQKISQSEARVIRKLNMIMNVLINPETKQEVTIQSNLLPDFPLSTIEKFLEFEKDLQNDRDIRKQFKNYLAKIGGKSFANKIRNIMKYTVHDNVAKMLSWTGQKQSRGIQNTSFVSIIIDYICSTEKCTLTDAQKVIQEWLRHAGDRINYLLKKGEQRTVCINYNA
ncbi:uncharacterized protein [Linepithema humile]|uniref:uncharacterized protein isoform X1 n=2 Tax=Linepithema humile TaxID=83485 RepID=UPI00351DCA87